MASMSKAIIIGNLGKDPVIKNTPSGKMVANFSVATTYGVGDKAETTWLNVVAWEKLAEICSKYLSKGKQVYVEGRIATRSWDDKEGKKQYITEVIASQVLFLGVKDVAQPSKSVTQGAPEFDEIPF